MRVLTLIPLLCLALPATAGVGTEQWYDCDVQQFYVLDESGNLQMKTLGYEGASFRVDRNASIIVGDKINTLYNVDVVTSNPTGSGVYSLVNYSRKNDGEIRRLSSLTVQDFGAQKPFVLAEGNYVFTGLCR